MSTSHLDRVLHCLCTISKERGLFRIITRDASIGLLGELNMGPIWHVLVAGVDELLKLSLNCCHYLRMAMTNVIYRHTAIEIDIALALDIPYLGVLSAFCIDRKTDSHTIGQIGRASCRERVCQYV